MSAAAFLDRVFQSNPSPQKAFHFASWKHAGRPTREGVGILPVANVPVDAMAARIMAVDHYKGNIDYVVESRSIPDAQFTPPGAVRFYQRIQIPMVTAIHMELVLTDFGERDGWRVLAWDQHAATDGLSTKQGARSQYNVGAWLLRSDAIGYALSSSPRKEDIGRLKFAAMTKGADASAPKVLRNNIEGMLRWARRA